MTHATLRFVLLLFVIMAIAVAAERRFDPPNPDEAIVIQAALDTNSPGMCFAVPVPLDRKKQPLREKLKEA